MKCRVLFEEYRKKEVELELTRLTLLQLVQRVRGGGHADALLLGDVADARGAVVLEAGQDRQLGAREVGLFGDAEVHHIQLRQCRADPGGNVLRGRVSHGNHDRHVCP